MQDSLLFILSEDVEFIPVNSLDYRTRRHFNYEETDIVVTHFNTRKSSKIIDPDSAELLKEFRSPRSWAEVIFQFASAHDKDPQDVAEEAYQLLVDMHQDGFLVPFKPNKKTDTKSLFEVNDLFEGYVIKEKKRILDDTEVYFGEDTEGTKYALKFIKNLPDNEIPNEVRILKMLDGSANVALIDEGRHLNSHYMITEWFGSHLCKQEADRYRNYLDRDNVIKALDLCINILLAYRQLHKQGILHGDVNDENILISATGAVKIIDYNMSVLAGQKRGMREGVCYYYDPELVTSRLNGGDDDPPTLKSEQYAIAAVLYFILAGTHYIEFSIEKEKLYLQILHNEPISFTSRDLNLPWELDRVFSKALAKDPSNRFDSLDDFAGAIIKIQNSVLSDTKYFVTGKGSDKRLIQFMMETYGWESPLFRKGFSLPPTASINFGAAGIAYMFYRMACIREQADMLDLADIWINRAETCLSNHNNAFYADEIEINETTVGRNSLFHGPAGIYLVQSLVESCKGDYGSVHQSLDRYLATSKKVSEKMDLTLGKSGLLLGFAMLHKDLKTIRHFDLSSLIIRASTTMKDLWKRVDQFENMKLKNAVDYFGIAHGWAGILYATLFWCSESKQDLPEQFTRRVDQLRECMFENKSMVYWPVTTSDKRPWTGWCNGSAGHVFLWSLLYRHLKDEKYLDIADRAARHVLQDTGSGIYNLCCGMSGQAYALLCLYNLTGDKIYLDHAQKLKQRILGNLSYPSERINSLYKSMPGAAILFCELERPELARMPLFE